MDLIAFAVRDEKAEAWAHPFFANAKGLAVRMFSDWCNDVSTPLGKHPEDFSLWRVGEFDDQSGTLTAYSVPERVLFGLDATQRSLPLRAVGGGAD